MIDKQLTLSANKMYISVGDKVSPYGETKDSLTYGYVREIFEGDRKRTATAYVYWPQIKQCGSWPCDELMK